MSVLSARSRLRVLPLLVALLAVAPALVASPAQAVFQQVTNTSPPTVTASSGDVPEVGGTVTASPGTWTPDGVSFAYQWLADGTSVAGATDPSLAVTRDLLGKKLSVRVTGTKFLDTAGTATSAQTAAVENPTIRNTALPAVKGIPTMGNTMGSQNGTWSPSGATFTRQWFADGQAIEGATGTTYKLTPAEVGKRLAIRVTASKEGFQTSSATSPLSAAIAPGSIRNFIAPTIYGSLKVGQLIGVSSGSWAPSDVQWTYRWFADDAVIPDLTTQTFIADQSLFGKTLRAEVTGAKPGYTSAVATSPESAPVSCDVAKPTNLAKSVVSKTTLTVKWATSFCATTYTVRYRLANASSWKTVPAGNVTRFRISGLLKARSYRVAVAAVGPDGVQTPFTSSILVKTSG